MGQDLAWASWASGGKTARLPSSQSSNRVRPMVVQEHGGGRGEHIYKKLQDSIHLSVSSAHLLNFNEQSYNGAINPRRSPLRPRQPETKDREAVGSLVTSQAAPPPCGQKERLFFSH